MESYRTRENSLLRIGSDRTKPPVFRISNNTKKEKNYFFPPFAWAGPFFSSAFALRCCFLAALCCRCCTLCRPLPCRPLRGCTLCTASAPFAGSAAAAAASSVTTGAATTLSPTSFGAAMILPLTLIVLTFRCEGVGSLWPLCRSASLIFSRYWGSGVDRHDLLVRVNPCSSADCLAECKAHAFRDTVSTGTGCLLVLAQDMVGEDAYLEVEV